MEVNKKTAVGCTSVIVALGLTAFGLVTWKGMNEGRPVLQTGGQTAQQTEGTNDCFIPKQGSAPCIVDMTGARVERASANGACQGIRVTVETDTDLAALDTQARGEVVMQVHPEGGGNDGSADTGVGMGRYSNWNTFRFGPNGAQPAPGASSGQISGQNVTLQLDSFADGSCIADDSQMRIKLQFDGPTGDPIYDILGFSGGLMEYHSITEHLRVFGAN